jgi:hypothetical protein
VSTSPISAPRQGPYFVGRRFKVFPWEIGNLQRLLGDHFDAFDVDAWFLTLDAEAARSGAVIPQADRGAWLLEQTFNEAHRRGLPIAVSLPTPTIGKQTARLAAAVANINRSRP